MRPYPINYSISECKIINEIPKKERDFAHIIPGRLDTYIYDDELEYYKDYQRSYFGITTKKAGWDCLRHYEILANGCIPYFVDLDKCDKMTMAFMPRELIYEAMNLEGVSYLKIDHSKFNIEKYNTLLNQLLQYTRDHLTTKKMASYILERINYQGNGNILLLSQDAITEYMRDMTLMGLKELFENKVVDYPKIEYIYQSYAGDVKKIANKGFTYSKILRTYPNKFLI